MCGLLIGESLSASALTCSISRSEKEKAFGRRGFRFRTQIKCDDKAAETLVVKPVIATSTHAPAPITPCEKTVFHAKAQ